MCVSAQERILCMILDKDSDVAVETVKLLFLSKMAARSDAAATPGPKNGVFMSVSLVSSSSNCLTLLKNQKTNTRKHIYDRQSLLDIDNVYKHQLSRRLLRSYKASVCC